MGLFSDIISSISNGWHDVFGGGGGNNDDQRKRQQQQQNTPAPQLNNGPVKLPAVFQAAQQQQQQQNPVLHLTPINPPQQPQQQQQPQNPAPNAPTINTTNYAQPAPHQSLWGHLLHGAENVAEGAAGVGAGAALGTLRAGEGLVQGVGQLPSDVVHLGTLGANKAGLISDQTRNDINNDVTGVTNKVLAPVDWLAKQTDNATGMFNHENGDQTITGRIIHDIYTPAQIAANVATVIPAASAAAAKVAALAGDAGKAGDIINGVNDFAKAQSAIPTLTKVPVLGTALSHIPGVGGESTSLSDATATSDKAPVESGIKAPAEPANAPAGEKNAPPVAAPGAVESGVKPPAVETPAEAPVVTPTEAPKTAAPTSTPTPSLKPTGNSEQDLQNAAALVRNRLENPRTFGPDTTPARGANAPSGALLTRVARAIKGGQSPKDVLDSVINQLNARPGDVIAESLGKRLSTHLTDAEQENVEHAIQTGDTTGLSDKEKTVVNSLVNDVEKPSDVSRSSLSNDYQSRENHFPQVRAPGSVSDAVKAASRGSGLSGKVNSLEDVLNTKSRFSEASSMGKFTDANGNTIVGDAPDLGLHLDGNGSYTDGKNTYTYSPATSRELRAAGVKLQAPKDALITYVKDTLAQKDRADAADYLKNNPEKVGLSRDSMPGKSTPISIKGSDGKEDTFFGDKKTVEKIHQSGITGRPAGEPNGLTKAFNKATNAVTEATVANPSVHSANLATNAAIAAGPKALRYALEPTLDEDTLLKMRDSGTYQPTYGSNQVNTLSKLTHGASKVNEKLLTEADQRIRYGMFKKFTEDDGLTPQQASQKINQWMGGKEVYGNGGAQFGMFWKYFLRQGANSGRLLTEAAKGNPAPLIRAGVMGGLMYGADKGLGAIQGGDKNAYVRMPGMLGIANDAVKSASDIKSGDYKSALNPILSHINPLLEQAAEQILGVNYYGDKFKPGIGPRVANAAEMTPVTNMFNNNGHSIAEKILNTFGIYTPHIKGDMATAPNSPASFLNVKNAQNGASTAFPQDYQGEQLSKAVNGFVNQTGGNDYTYKNAATIASQTPQEQQAFTAGTKALETAGVSSASAPTYAKDMMNMSKSDQADYLKAIKDINTSTDGTTLSASSIESQLAKNGNIPLAASLNKGISSSLSQQDKNTLETYKLKGETYLEDNTNAYNYYMADIKNKNALGTLTTGPDKDTDMGTAFSGTGGTLYVKAAVAKTNAENNVPQSLQDLYYHTTKTEYEKMSGTQKDQLTAYAQQLNSNGVIDKFGLATGTSGGSSYGYGSSGKTPSQIDAAAGIPYGTISGAFVKPTSDAGLKSVKATAFVQPKMAKYAPLAKANPFVRSISAVKGVK